MKQKLLLFAIIFSLGIGIVIFSYLNGHWWLNHPSPIIYPIRGIDVSHHQGKINWDLVKDERFHFVFIKATEGGDHKDREFKRNWDEASRIGMLKGAYHFFTFCKPGIEQAQNFIDSVPIEPDTLPPVIDFEFAGNCAERPEKELLLKELFTFINLIEAKYGQSPILYVTRSSYKQYLQGEIDNYHIWIRDIFFQPKLPKSKPWTFWQYTDRGRVGGIKGPVDLNVSAYKNVSEMKNIR